MSDDDSLIEAMPDFVAFLRRDGVLLRHHGGRRLGLVADPELIVAGRRAEQIWSGPVAQLIRQGIRKVLATRSSETLRFDHEGRGYEARVSAHGRDRAICVIRTAARESAPAGAEEGIRSASTERREFYAQLEAAIAGASLREQALAVALIELGGLDEIGGLIDFALAQQVLAALRERLTDPRWQLSRVGDALLGLIIPEAADREQLRAIGEDLHRRLREPVQVGDAAFAVRPSLGIAVLGEDGARAGALLDHAQSAMLEARRADSGGVQFYSDTLRLRALARLDFQRELANAIAADAFALRYAARCELGSGRRVAVNAYLRWPGSLRQEIKPSEFLPVAESTGLALELSRWALRRMRRDAGALRAALGADVVLSFGALRQHFADGALLADVREWLASGEIEASSLELRIAERALAGLGSPGRVLRPLRELGVRLVVDEFGRGQSSLARLARLPITALQIDRGLIVSARQDAVSARAARGALALAQALELRSIAAGIDTDTDRGGWAALGCAEGLGDCFGVVEPALESAPGREIAAPPATSAVRSRRGGIPRI